MKISFGVLICAASAMASAPLKAVIVSYPQGTSSSIMDQAKDAIKAAGGFISHEYHLIHAFAANAPASALETIRTQGTADDVVIEEDQVVGVNGL